MDVTFFTIELDNQHMAVLDQLCGEQGLTRSQLLRQGLRLYQAEHLAAPAALSTQLRSSVTMPRRGHAVHCAVYDPVRGPCDCGAS